MKFSLALVAAFAASANAFAPASVEVSVQLLTCDWFYVGRGLRRGDMDSELIVGCLGDALVLCQSAKLHLWSFIL